jgi:hypothetical protein
MNAPPTASGVALRPVRARPRRLLLALWVPFATLLLLEVLLQVGALVSYWTRPGVASAEGHSASILCVGDSFTYGIGTTVATAAYPMQLERILRERGHDVSVASFALPGRNSREALGLLDGQLEKIRPRIVCAMIGRNDEWSKPGLLVLPTEGGPQAEAVDRSTEFVFEWRTGRLLQLFLSRLRDQSAPENVPEDPEPAAAAGSAPETAAITDPWEAIRLQQPDVARRIWEAEIASREDGAPYARSGLVFAYRALGLREEADAQLAWLREVAGTGTRRDVALALVAALGGVGAARERLAAAKLLVQKYPDAVDLWDAIAWESFQLGDQAAAQSASDEAAARLSEQESWSADVLLRRAIILRNVDLPTAIRCAVRAALIGGTKEASAWGIPGCTPAELEDALSAMEVDAARRDEIRRFFGRRLGWDRADFERVLDAHLEQIVRRSIRAGARPMLISYPVLFPYVEGSMERVAKATGAVRIPMARLFKESIQGKDLASFLVTDGHCNDAGYAVLAGIVADHCETVLAAVREGR